MNYESLLKEIENKVVGGVIVVTFSLIIWSSYGFTKILVTPDMGLFLYGGQQILEGQVPYTHFTEIKMPLTYFSSALGLLLFSDGLGMSQVLATRIPLLACGIGTVFCTYQIGRKVLDSNIGGIISGVGLAGVTVFGIATVTGRPKVLMIAFGIGSLYVLERKQYFLAGCFSMLSLLAWQPGGVFILVAAGRAYWCEDSQARQHLFAGLLLPSGSIVVYFALNGSLVAFIQQTILYSLRFSSARGGILVSIKQYNVISAYLINLPLVISGIGGTALLFWQERLESVQPTNKWYLVTVPFVILFVYTLIDVQGYYDYLPLLPFLAIFSAYLILSATDYVLQLDGPGPVDINQDTPRYAISIILLLFVTAYSVGPYLFYPAQNPSSNTHEIGTMRVDKQQRGNDEFLSTLNPVVSVFDFIIDKLTTALLTLPEIDEQQEVANHVTATTDSNDTVLSVAAPEILFLANRENAGTHPRLSPFDIWYIENIQGDGDYRERINAVSPEKIVISRYKNGFKKLEQTGIAHFVETKYCRSFSTRHYIVLEKCNQK